MRDKDRNINKDLSMAQSHWASEAFEQNNSDRQGKAFFSGHNTMAIVEIAAQELEWEVLCSHDRCLFQLLPNEIGHNTFDNKEDSKHGL